MKFWIFLRDIFSDCNKSESSSENAVNPATGLPMLGGVGGVDLEGNPWGLDKTSLSVSDDCSWGGITDASGSSEIDSMN